jgi:toxin ParE1/3/4
MSRYTIAPAARRDLYKIHSYLVEHSATAAQRVREVLLQKFRYLASQRLAGELRADLGPDVRIFAAENYAILYRPSTRGIQVLRLIHGSQNLPTEFART